MASEIEFKVRLADAAAAERLVEAARARAAGPVESAHQRNHFFDTARGDLRRARLAVRLREAKGRVVLTLKGAGVEAAAGDPSSRPEEEVEVPVEAARDVLEREGSVLSLAREHLPAGSALLAAVEAAAGGGPLIHVGSFSNDRRRIGPLDCAGHPAMLEVDRTRFPGDRVDHEAELEVPEHAVDAARKTLEELLAAAGLPWTPSTSKASRFFALLGP